MAVLLLITLGKRWSLAVNYVLHVNSYCVTQCKPNVVIGFANPAFKNYKICKFYTHQYSIATALIVSEPPCA